MVPGENLPVSLYFGRDIDEALQQLLDATLDPAIEVRGAACGAFRNWPW